VVAVRGIYAGEPEQARRALAGLWRAGGPPIADGFAPMGYAGTAAIGGTAPRQFDRFDDLPDALIGDLVAAVSGPEPTASAVEVRQWGGAIARPGANAGPVGHRNTPFSVTVDGPAAAAGPIRRHATGGSFLNFLHDPTRTQDAYDAIDHMRLRKVKRDYDPENFFCLGHNIPPLPSMSFAVAGSL
jgi:hypothetical protein